MNDAVYEQLRAQIAQLTSISAVNERDVEWASEAHILGFSRSMDGAVELFLVGAPILAVSDSVGRHVVHGEWRTNDGSTLQANRLLLPNEPHFDRVAAFVCAELLLNGVDSDLVIAFARSEPIIDVALLDGDIDGRSLLGLCGELLFLDALVRGDECRASAIAIDCWSGYGRSSRDFQLGEVGVEVKTTTRAVSEHHVQGPYQVELGASVSGLPETALFLASIGIVWLPMGSSSGFSVPSLVEAIATRLGAQDRELFMQRIAVYAGTAGRGYVHGSGSNPPEFLRQFSTSFVRLYDLTDSRIRLPGSDLLAGMDLIPDSVSYRIVLPSVINGSLNPLDGLAVSASHVLGLYT